jgi:hypothetical protein
MAPLLPKEEEQQQQTGGGGGGGAGSVEQEQEQEGAMLCRGYLSVCGWVGGWLRVWVWV